MKKVIALVVVLTLITLGSYLGCGLLARTSYGMAMSELQANFPGHMESSYKQGLFSSELQLQLDIPIPDTNADSPQTISTRIRQTVHHGPFALGGQRKISSMLTPVQLYAQGSLEVDPFMANEPPFITQLRQLATTDITVLTAINSRTEVSFTGNPLQTTIPMGTDNFTLNWQGFAGHLSLEGSNLLTYDLDFNAPGLEVSGQGAERLVVEGITTQIKMREGNHKLSLGTVLTAMEKFEAQWNNGREERVTMTGLNIRITSSEKAELIRLEEEINLDHLRFADKEYGPSNLKISLDNLDAQAVAKLTEAYKAMQVNPGNNEVMALGLLTSHATALLAKSPEIRIENLSLTSPEGGSLSRGHIAFNGEGEVILNPLFLLGRLSAEADFSADEHFMAMQAKNFIKDHLCAERPEPSCDQEAARASSKKLQTLIDQNILLLANGKYTLTASFKNGQPMLNGQPVPLSF